MFIGKNYDSMITAKKLIKLLKKVPPDYLITVNRVMNLTILKKDDETLNYVGYIEIGGENLELFDDQ